MPPEKTGGVQLLDPQSSVGQCLVMQNLAQSLLFKDFGCKWKSFSNTGKESPGPCLINNVVALEINSWVGALPIRAKPDCFKLLQTVRTLSGTHISNFMYFLDLYFFVHTFLSFYISLRAGYMPELSLYP